ncbi:anti-sigma factor [Microbispora sp. NPDC049125]|uniref:anti-sigma factor family protein n=1 Tax=Microbispora sp. NPDC049125 TaxID=3154929 RepID=UPI0034655DC1
MTCEDVRISLGVYVLGALDDDEAAQVEAHLDDCPACRAELAELSGLPSRLALVSADDIDRAAQPPRAVLDRLVAASARRSRRSRVLLALAASAVVAALGGTAWLSAAHQTGGPSTADTGVAAGAAPARSSAARVEADQNPASPLLAADSPDPSAAKAAPPTEVSRENAGVRLAVRLTPQAGGTKVVAEVSGVPSGTVCSLQAVGRDGTVTAVGSWLAGPGGYQGGAATFEGATALQAGEIRRFELTTPDGRRLVTLPL